MTIARIITFYIKRTIFALYCGIAQNVNNKSIITLHYCSKRHKSYAAGCNGYTAAIIAAALKFLISAYTASSLIHIQRAITIERHRRNILFPFKAVLFVPLRIQATIESIEPRTLYPVYVFYVAA